jgi:putative hydrolase of the HAD superfamily
MPGNLDNASSRAVFFDLAGTLIRVRGGIGARYSTIAREYGVDADASAIDGAFPGAFASVSADSRRGTGPQIRADFRRFAADEVASLEKGFWKEVVRRIFADAGALAQFRGDQFDRYFDRLFDYFATAAGWTIYPDVVPVLGDLKGRGFVLGLITNFDSRVFKLIEALDLSRFIDSITIPALAGAAKPEAAIFEYALARHGLRPSEAVQVGDSLRDDVEGAGAAGLRGVLIDRNRFARSGQGPSAGVARSGHGADYATITSLEELTLLLGIRP